VRRKEHGTLALLVIFGIAIDTHELGGKKLGALERNLKFFVEGKSHLLNYKNANAIRNTASEGIGASKQYRSPSPCQWRKRHHFRPRQRGI